MAADDTQLLLSISADTRQALRVLKKFGADIDDVATRGEQAFTKPEKQVEKLGQAMGKSSVQTSNLAAQFQDIVVQLSGGQSPFQIALQQGTQIVGALGNGQGGLRGTVTALGGAFASLVSPVSLATIALITLGGIGIQYITDMMSGTDDLDKQLKAHKDLIASIKDAYGEAAKGVDDYVAQSGAVLEKRLKDQILQLTGQLQSQVSGALSEIGKLSVAIDSAGNIVADRGFEPLVGAVARLRESAKNGVPDVRAFRAEIAEIAAAEPSNKTLQTLVSRLLSVTSGADDAQVAVIQANRAIGAMEGIASGSAAALNEYRDALEQLAKVALPQLSPREQASKLYNDALRSADGPGERQAATDAYLASLQRIDAEEQKLADERAKRDAQQAARRSKRDAERDQERIERTIEGLQFEAEQLGRTAREQAIYNAVAAAGVDITSQQGQKVAALAGHLYDLQEAQAAAIAEMDTLRSTATDVLGGFLSDIRNGVSAADALNNALNRVLDTVLDIAVQNLVAGLFGAPGTTQTGSLGGLLSGIFGGSKAVGGPVNAGQIYRVGERGPEMFVPDVAGRIVPNHAMTGGKGGGTSVPISISIDARGADEAGLARVQQQLAQLRGEIPRMVVTSVANAKRRNVQGI